MKASADRCVNAAMAAVSRDPPIMYTQEDCQGFIEATLRRAGGEMNDYAGSNDMYRNAVTGVIPLGEAIDGRMLVPGMVLFIVSQDGNEPAKYRDDGLGNASHVGMYTGGVYEVVHSSASKGMVAASTLKNGWTHAGWLREVDYGETQGQLLAAGAARIGLPADETVFHRISPSHSSKWFGRIRGGEAVELVSVKDGWARVKYGGHDGYVWAAFIIGGAWTPLPEINEVTFTFPRGAAETLLAALNAALEKRTTE